MKKNHFAAISFCCLLLFIIYIYLIIYIMRDLVSVTSVCFRIYICICASICSFRLSENLHLYLCVRLLLWTIWEFTFIFVHPFVPLHLLRIYICICASICSFGQSKNLHNFTVPYLNRFILLCTFLSLIDFWFIYFCHTLLFLCTLLSSISAW